MNHQYTRQRQGRDFSARNNSGKKNKSLLEHLERCKEEAERNAVPVDGSEPLPERGRDLV